MNISKPTVIQVTLAWLSESQNQMNRHEHEKKQEKQDHGTVSLAQLATSASEGLGWNTGL